MNSAIRFLAVALGCACLPIGVVQAQDPQFELGDEDPASYRATLETEGEQNLEVLRRAYGLSEDEVNDVRRDMSERIDADVKLRPALRVALMEVARGYAAENEKRGENWELTDEIRRRIEAPLDSVNAKLKFTFEGCQKYVETRVGSGRAVAGRDRIGPTREEIQREVAEKVRRENEAAVGTEVVMELASAEHRKADAELSPAGNPMPKAAFTSPAPSATPTPQMQQPVAAPPPPVEKPRPVQRREPPPARVEAPASPPQVAIEAPRLAPAPPIDEWDKHVDSVAQKYKFTADQKGRAQAILKDLRDRARQYRKSHASDFERLKRITDGVERSTEEKHLNQPLDELFAELKERLEVLPTREQREAAGGQPGR